MRDQDAEVIVPDPERVETPLSPHARFADDSIPTHFIQVVVPTPPLFGASIHVYGGQYPLGCDDRSNTNFTCAAQ